MIPRLTEKEATPIGVLEVAGSAVGSLEDHSQRTAEFFAAQRQAGEELHAIK